MDAGTDTHTFPTEYIYDAFISYSHRDMAWGKWLQKKLETYRIPKGLGMKRARRRLRIFRDQTDLAGVELQASLRREMEVSEYLIVLCSPSSAASVWVEEEVRYFISLGRTDHIIPFIVEGEPESDDPSLECYPAPLRTREDDHMLGANVQEIGKNKAFLKLVSILLGVRFNRIVDREQQRRRRTILISSLTAAAVISTGSALLIRSARLSKKNHELSYDIYGAAIVSIAEKDEIEPADVEFLLASAQEDNTDAILLLADCYRNGWGVEQDYEQCFYWFLRGAELGDPLGMLGLSNCYTNGEGTQQSYAEAFAWDLKAAEAGDAGGMLNTAICYEEGLGTDADPAQALYWYLQSAENGSDFGMYHTARCYMAGVGTDADPVQAFYWMQKLADTGNAEGMYNLGLMYQHAFGTDEDPAQAYYWYRQAAEAGDADGAYMTGWCIENGYGITDTAAEWYKRAAALGSTEASEALGKR